MATERDRIARLERELEALRAEVNRPVDIDGDAAVSRRSLLRHLGGAAVAGAGLAAGSAALATRSADATQTVMSTGIVNDGGDEGTALTSTDEAHTLRVTNSGPGTALLLTLTDPTNADDSLDVSTSGTGMAIKASAEGLTTAKVTNTGTGTALEATGAGDTTMLVTNTAASPKFGTALQVEGGRNTPNGSGGGISIYATPGTKLQHGLLVNGARIALQVNPEEGGTGLDINDSGPENTLGIRASGTRAPILLTPKLTDGPPTLGFHEVGEFVTGATNGLFQCIAGGTPGTWVRVGFNPLVPARIADTRDGQGTNLNVYSGQHLAASGQAGDTILIQVGGFIGIDEVQLVPRQASAVVLNVTATNIGAEGFLTVYPADVAKPVVSNVNFDAPPKAPAAIPNQVTVKLGSTLSPNFTGIKIFNGSAAPVDVIVDVAGFFS